MTWFLLALAAAVIWALNNILDKFILTKKLRNPYTFNILTMIYDIIPILIIISLFSVTVSHWSIIAFLAGMPIVPALFLYNKAMMFEEVSRVGSLTYIYPIFTAILGFAFLGESFGLLNYAGVILLTAGAVAISYKKSKSGKFFISPALFLLLAYSMLWAAETVASDYTLNFFGFWSFYAWSLAGSLSGGLLMLVPSKKRKMFNADVRNCGRRTLSYVFLTSAIFYIGEILFVAALSAGPASLVSALSATEPLFILFFALLLSTFRPGILKEHTDRLTVMLKISAIAMIFLGGYLVTVV